jgi:hypothetical protein
MSHDFCLIGELIFCGKYDIIYIERKLRGFICYTDKEVRIFLEKTFQKPLDISPILCYHIGVPDKEQEGEKTHG